jgi:hypothetical protein
MFPNHDHMEFVVRERIAERYATAEKYRLGQRPARQGALALRSKLGRVIYWLGCQMISWSELLRHSDNAAVADQPERLAP